MNKLDLPNFIPSTPISPAGPLSNAYLQNGVNTFYDAVYWTFQLPYGRNSDRANYMLVFDELKGTCSTKHAALAALASECQLPVYLKMVICKLNQKLDPRVKPLLEKLGVDFIPEAHCYLSFPEGEIDVTFPDQTSYPKAEVIKDYLLLPDEIGERKLALHKEFVINWLEGSSISFDEFWKIREEWITFLST